MASPLAIVAALTLFVAVGFLFLFVNLLVGKFLRPKDPHAEKLEIYECGEPTIGSSFVQFDLRFYVVALLFIIFDVEIAFFFPWANAFGKATNLMDPQLQTVAADGSLTAGAEGLYRELGVTAPAISNTVGEVGPAGIAESARMLAWFSVFDILVFFAVLMVGFFYVWKRGDLDWVRTVSRDRERIVEREPVDIEVEQQPAVPA